MPASAARTPQFARDDGSVLSFKDAQAGVEQVAGGDDNDVESLSDLVTTENLSNQSFSSVSFYRTAELARRGDAQPSNFQLVGEKEDRAVTAADPEATLVNQLKISPTANVLASAKPQSLLFAADRQPLPAFRAPALEHQSPVFRAHPDEKPVRPAPVTPVRLKRSLALHALLSSAPAPKQPAVVNRTDNVSERL
jgi:hypothetical protein